MHKIGTFGSTANRFLHLQNCTGFWCKQRQIKMCIVIIQIKYKQPKPGYFWLMRKLVLLSKPWVIIKREDRAKWVVDFQCNSVIVCSNPQTSHTQTHTHILPYPSRINQYLISTCSVVFFCSKANCLYSTPTTDRLRDNSFTYKWKERISGKLFTIIQ